MTHLPTPASLTSLPFAAAQLAAVTGRTHWMELISAELPGPVAHRRAAWTAWSGGSSVYGS